MTDKDTTQNTRRKHEKIPDDLMQQYVSRKISSTKLSELTGYHAVYLRRSIKRDEKPEPVRVGKQKLFEARDKFRASLAHLPLEELAKQANVSISTARRIKKANNVR